MMRVDEINLAFVYTSRYIITRASIFRKDSRDNKMFNDATINLDKNYVERSLGIHIYLHIRRLHSQAKRDRGHSFTKGLVKS